MAVKSRENFFFFVSQSYLKERTFTAVKRGTTCQYKVQEKGTSLSKTFLSTPSLGSYSPLNCS